MMKNVVRLQRAQNAIARIVVWGTNRQLTSLSVLLKHYHWLPVLQRIQFKIACITYKPAYLNSVLEHYTPARSLRSSDNILLFVSRVRTCFGSRNISVDASTIWNFFPFDIYNSCSRTLFPRQLETFFKLSSVSIVPRLTPEAQIRQVFRRHCELY